MEYRREAYPDGNIDEQYIGTPEEIIKLMNNMGCNKKEDLSLEILQKLGIPVMNNKGRLRSMEDIFNDLSDVFNKDKEELIYDQKDAIEFIKLNQHYASQIRETAIKDGLALEEDYMRSVGIIKD